LIPPPEASAIAATTPLTTTPIPTPIPTPIRTLRQDVASRVTRFDVVDLLDSLDLVEGDLLLLQLLPLLVAQFETSAGDLADPASQLGTVGETDLHGAAAGDRVDIFFRRGAVGRRSPPKAIAAHQGCQRHRQYLFLHSEPPI
jgi:hypothetical protein